MSYTKTGKSHHQYKHGAGSAKIRNPLYQKWAAMKRRCLNKHERSYKDYGGRGIIICEAWMSYENFAHDMEPTFKAGLSLERIDNDGNYEKNNCKWIPLAEQAKNKRTVTLYEYAGQKRSIPEWAKIVGIQQDTLFARLKRYKWPISEALTVNTSYENKYR